MNIYTEKQAANAGRNSAKAINTAEGMIANRIEQMKAHIVACNGQGKVEKAFRDAWKAQWEALNSCNEQASRAAYSRYKRAALAGQTQAQSPADKRAKEAAKAKGSKTKPASSASGAATASPSPSKEGAQPSGNVVDFEVAAGLAEEAAKMRKKVEGGEMPTAKQLAAFCGSIITRLEIGTGKQLVD